MNPPKVLIFDIETSFIEAGVWGLFDQNVALNQILEDWNVISIAAKWLGDAPSKIMFRDVRKAGFRNDKALCKWFWHLLNKADAVLTQNGNAFDVKKMNARFAIHAAADKNFPQGPPKSFQKIDTLLINRKHFAFTSNKLEYVTDKLCKKHKKSKHKKFPGFEMWTECRKGNKEAWDEMMAYNKIDVLSLEEAYLTIRPWDNSPVFTQVLGEPCKLCGCKDFAKNGVKRLQAGEYQRYNCKKCGHEVRGRENLLSKDDRKKRLMGVNR